MIELATPFNLNRGNNVIFPDESPASEGAWL
jgi:hypothetical protein